jgi:hypothetical protein
MCAQTVIRRDIIAIYEDHPFQRSRDPETLKGIMHSACLGEVEDGLAVVAGGRKKASERREESDFDRQR